MLLAVAMMHVHAVLYIFMTNLAALQAGDACVAQAAEKIIMSPSCSARGVYVSIRLCAHNTFAPTTLFSCLPGRWPLHSSRLRRAALGFW